jgi:uncharacterized protein (TIGR02300 family)
MPKEEWGVKRVCPETGKRFYDMGRDPVVSPYTGQVVPIDTGAKTRVLSADKDDVDAVKAKETEDEDLLLDDDDVEDEEDADVKEGDDTVLEDDDDDTVPLDTLADVADDKDDD